MASGLWMLQMARFVLPFLLDLEKILNLIDPSCLLFQSHYWDYRQTNPSTKKLNIRCRSSLISVILSLNSPKSYVQHTPAMNFPVMVYRMHSGPDNLHFNALLSLETTTRQWWFDQIGVSWKMFWARKPTGLKRHSKYIKSDRAAIATIEWFSFKNIPK